MKAAITTRAGDPEVVKIQEMPMPELKSGWVHINTESN